MKVRDRRVKACQHCYKALRRPLGREDVLWDEECSEECMPGLKHKLMPVVSDE